MSAIGVNAMAPRIPVRSSKNGTMFVVSQAMREIAVETANQSARAAKRTAGDAFAPSTALPPPALAPPALPSPRASTWTLAPSVSVPPLSRPT